MASTVPPTLQHSPLGRLAPELRLEIYRMVLTHDKPLYRPSFTDLDDVRSSRSVSRLHLRDIVDTRYSALTILTTCKAIRDEAIEELYSRNTFVMLFIGARALLQYSPPSVSIRSIILTDFECRQPSKPHSDFAFASLYVMLTARCRNLAKLKI